MEDRFDDDLTAGGHPSSDAGDLWHTWSFAENWRGGPFEWLLEAAFTGVWCFLLLYLFASFVAAPPGITSELLDEMSSPAWVVSVPFSQTFGNMKTLNENALSCKKTAILGGMAGINPRHLLAEYKSCLLGTLPDGRIYRSSVTVLPPGRAEVASIVEGVREHPF